MKWTEKDVSILKEKYSKLGSKECSKLLNRNTNSVIKKASRLKIKVNKKITSSIRSNKAKKSWNVRYEKTLNENFIKKVKTDIKNIDNDFAYVLGYLWGDGYLLHQGKNGQNSISLEIVKDDGEEIKKIMNYIANWNIYYRNRKNRKPQIIFYLGNKKFVEYLISLGFDKKSYISHQIIIENIPEENRNSFYLGLSDADGCFYINKKNYNYQYIISSTYYQDWSCIENLFNELDIKYKINKIENKKNNGTFHKSSNIRISNKKDVIKFGNYLYKGKLKGLNRKYDIFKNIENSITNI